MLGLHHGELRMQAQGWDFTPEAIESLVEFLAGE